MLVSIFNDVIGPVMRGPSSSHCAAALRIGRLARDLMGGQFKEVLVEFDLKGSLPTTHDSQGSGWIFLKRKSGFAEFVFRLAPSGGSGHDPLKLIPEMHNKNHPCK